MLSDAGWRRLFAADPQVVGRTIALDDEPHVVIGVAAPDRLEFIADPDLFQLIDLATTAAGDRRVRDLVTIGRLKKGFSRGAAETELRIVAKRLAHDYPADDVGRDVGVDGLREAHTGWNWRPLVVFLGSAVVVLLLSCANVANLLLARAVDRRREFAIRGALGGGRTAPRAAARGRGRAAGTSGRRSRYSARGLGPRARFGLAARRATSSAAGSSLSTSACSCPRSRPRV